MSLHRRTASPARLLAAGCALALAACGAAGSAPSAAPSAEPSEPQSTVASLAPPAAEPAPTEPSPTALRCTASGPPPPELGFDPFYAQYCDVGGIPLLAHGDVDPVAMARAGDVIDEMLDFRPDVRAALAVSTVRVGIMGVAQVTTDMPEWSDLNEAFPDTDWDTRGRGFGATVDRPLVAAGEENLLCLPEDLYLGESIWVHELSHTVLQFGLEQVDPTFYPRLSDAYASAMAEGLWLDTYAATDPDEYWAEGVQSYFDTNLADDFQHNDVDTRDELAAYDPTLFTLVEEAFGPSDWRHLCPDGSPV